MLGTGDELCIDANTAAAWVAGDLTIREAAAVERHIDGCSDCRSHLSEVARGSQRSLVPTEPLTPGTQVGRYVIMGPLGRGGMGIVYRARDPELGRAVALKALTAHGADARDRLAREARAMAQLSHPNVVAVYDLVAVGDAIFIAMELIEGVTLAVWLGQQRRSWRAIADVFRKAGAGIAAAHAAGLVHRDFKPDNVLVDDARQRVCVTDFGLASLEENRADEPEGSLERFTATGALVGTPAFMAPEQYRGEPATPASDQFAFCVALYEALHGESAFQGDTLRTRAEAVLAGARRSRPKDDVPSRIDRILDRGLRLAPAERHPSLAATLDALAPRSTRLLRYGTLALVLVIVATGATVLARRKPATAAHPTAASRLVGVWDPARKSNVQRAFEATKKSYALDAWRGAERAASTGTRGSGRKRST